MKPDASWIGGIQASEGGHYPVMLLHDLATVFAQLPKVPPHYPLDHVIAFGQLPRILDGAGGREVHALLYLDPVALAKVIDGDK